MTKLAWGDKYSVGIPAVDKEHQELFDGLNELHDALEKEQEYARIGQFLHSLADRTRIHFLSEEALMEENKYAGLNLHRLKHQHLMEQISAFTARFDRGGFTLNRYSMNFLAEWLTTHIVNDDKNFGLWLNKRGKL